MKKRFSKILCTILAFVMMLTALPLSSLAALTKGETQTIKFRILYVDSSFNIGYSYGSTWSATYTCADTTNHSDSAYSNHSINASDIRSLGVNRASSYLNAGYEVKGWNNSSTGSANPTIYTTYSGRVTTNASTYIHIVAKRSAVTYNLSYNANGGSYAPGSQSQQSSTGSVTFTVASGTPVKAGYRFLGWSTSSNATSPSFYAGSSFYTASQYNTLYAVWVPDAKYTVTYKDGANGTVFADKVYTDVLSGASTPSFGTVPSRPNYSFAGWSPSVASTVTKDVTYTAIWVPITYKVTYTDGVDGEEIFPDQSYTVNSGDKTPSFNGTPTRPGYVFDGWSPAVSDTVTGNVTYTPIWKEDKNNNGIDDSKEEKYTVTYTDGVNGEEIFADQVTQNILSGTKTPAFNGTPTRQDYIFGGWSPAVSDTVTGNTTYTAIWITDKNSNGIPDQDESHKVIFKDGADGEIFGDKEFEIFPGESDPDNINVPERPGYEFAGWITSKDENGNITNTAKWEKLPEETTQPDNGGNDNSISSNDPTKPGNNNSSDKDNNNNSSNNNNNNNSNNNTSNKNDVSNSNTQTTDNASTDKNDKNSSKADTEATSSANSAKSNGSSTSPKTGAQPEVLLWFALVILAASGVIAIPAANKKKREQN